MCPHGAYTCQGPQGSIIIHVALECLNMALNLELFVYMHVYAFVRHARRCLLMELDVMKVIEVDLIVV